MKAIQKEKYSTPPMQPPQQEQLPERREKDRIRTHSVSEEHREDHSEALYVRVFRYFFSIDISNENHIGAV